VVPAAPIAPAAPVVPPPPVPVDLPLPPAPDEQAHTDASPATSPTNTILEVTEDLISSSSFLRGASGGASLSPPASRLIIFGSDFTHRAIYLFFMAAKSRWIRTTGERASCGFSCSPQRERSIYP
jgi:hypothetical protein